MVDSVSTDNSTLNVQRQRKQLLAELEDANLIPGRGVVGSLFNLGIFGTFKMAQQHNKVNIALIDAADVIASQRRDEIGLHANPLFFYGDKNAAKATEYLSEVLAKHRAALMPTVAEVPPEQASSHFRDLVSSGSGKGRER